MNPEEIKIAYSLSQNGYKITAQRKAVLKVIAGSEEHLTTTDVYDKVRKELPGIGQVTVYRTMEILAELGHICRVHVGGRSRSYKAAPPEHHHHLICSDCGTVIDFAECDLSDLQRRLSSETGFEIDNHILEFIGRCENCQKLAPV